MTQILAVGAHPDDVETGCSGTLHLMQSRGDKINYLAFSMCEDGQAQIVGEYQKATKAWDNAWNMRLPNRMLPDHVEEIRDRLEKLKRELKPQIIFCPTTADLHQDHATASLTCRQVFRFSTVLGYETYKSGTEFVPRVFYELEDADVEFKRRIVSIYKTQRQRFDPEAIIALARYRGQNINSMWAEGFECIRMVNRPQKPN